MPRFTPHPYQEAARQMIFRNAACALFLEPGLGKAVADDTAVPMADGSFKRADAVEVGDLVVGSDGKGWPVEAVYPRGPLDAYRVVLADGRSLVCSEDHLTVYRTERFGEDRVAPLKEVMGLDWWAVPAGSGVGCEGGPTVGDAGAMGREAACSLAEAMAHGSCSMWLAQEGGRLAALMAAPAPERREWLFRLFGRLAAPETGAVALGAGDGARDVAAVLWRLCLSAGVPAYTLDKRGLWSVAVAPPVKCGEGPDGSELRRAPEAAPVARVEDMGRQVPMRCFTVGSPDHTFLVGDYVVTHNTSTVLSAVSDMALPVHQLVIAPKAIARTTWVDEIEKWGFPVRWRSLISGPKGGDLAPKERRARYAQAPCVQEPTMFFVNQELVPDLVGFYRSMGLPWPFPVVVVDEFQGFKSPESRRWQALASARSQIEMLVGLTGTPIPNGVGDLWAQMWLVDRGARLGATVDEFHRRWFLPSPMEVQGRPGRDGRRRTHTVQKWRPRKDLDVEAEMFSLVRDVAMSVRNTELDLPERVDSYETVHLSGPEMAQYRRLKEELKVELAGQEVTAANAAVLTAKLCQMASGTLYVDGPAAGGRRPYVAVHGRKLEALSHIVANTPDNVMVAYWYKADAERILARLRAELPAGQEVLVLDPSDASHQRRWNEGSVKVLLLHPASAGHGLNLQHGGHTLVWYTVPWSLECYQQTNARLWRQGQTRTTIVHHIVAEGTVEERLVSEVLPAKGRAQEALMEAVRREVA